MASTKGTTLLWSGIIILTHGVMYLTDFLFDYAGGNSSTFHFFSVLIVLWLQIAITFLWFRLNATFSHWITRSVIAILVLLLSHAVLGVIWVIVQFHPDLWLREPFYAEPLKVYVIAGSCLIIPICLELAHWLGAGFWRLIIGIPIFAVEMTLFALHTNESGKVLTIGQWGGKQNVVGISPVEFRGGMLTIEVQIQDSTLRFMVDTGAGKNVIDSRLADHFEMDSVDFADRWDANRTHQQDAIVSIPQIDVGELHAENIRAFSSDYSDTNFECQGIQGIIGAEMLSHFNWAIDYERSLFLQLRDSLVFSNRWVAVTMHQDKSGHPRVPVQVSSRQTDTVVFDTGFSGYIFLNRRLLPPDSIAKIKPEQHQFISHFGEYTIENIPLTYDSLKFDRHWLKVGTAYANDQFPVIGVQFFREKPVVFDFTHQQIWIDTTRSALPNNPSPVSPAPNRERVDHGLSFQWRNDTTLVVGAVTANSPANKANIQAGQELVEVNGQPPSRYFSGYCGFLAWRHAVLSQDTIQLRVSSHDHTATLVKHRYQVNP